MYVFILLLWTIPLIPKGRRPANLQEACKPTDQSVILKDFMKLKWMAQLTTWTFYRSDLNYLSLWTFKHVYSFVFMNRQILWLQNDYRAMWGCASTYLQNQKSMKEAEHKFVLHCHWKNNFCKSSAVQWLSRGREWWQVAFIEHCKWCEKTKELSDGVYYWSLGFLSEVIPH